MHMHIDVYAWREVIINFMLFSISFIALIFNLVIENRLIMIKEERFLKIYFYGYKPVE